MGETHGLELSPRLIRKRLVATGSYSYVAPKKPLMTARYRAARVVWAQERVDITMGEWGNVMFSDETPLHLVQTSQRQYFCSRRDVSRVPDVLQPILQGGGDSVMV